MSSGAETCEYTHELNSGTWHCPHEPGPDGRCIFHRPVTETPDGAAAEAFRDRVNDPGRRPKEFVGARFDHLNLAFTSIDPPDNQPVSLVDVHVEGELRLTNGAITQPLVLDGITVEGETVCENATFGAEVGAASARFLGGVDFQGAIFRERVRLEDATFDGPANFHAVGFDATADFEHSDFCGPTDFGRADFVGDAIFTDARFAGAADFDDVTIGGKADFRGVRFGDRAVFRDAHFGESVTFGVPRDDDRSTVEVAFQDGRRPTASAFEFEGVLEHVTRRQIEPDGDRVVDDDAPHFAAETDFVDAEFDEEVNFEAVEFGCPPSFQDVTFRDPVLIREPQVEGATIDLRESDIPAGVLGQRDDGDVVYDLGGATLGDVRIQGGRGAPFEHCRFVHTTFDGFDFGQYRESVAAADWQIHTTLSSLDRPDPTRGDLEATYLKAKNGADDVGDDKAAGEFLRQELEYRRQGYVARFRGEDSIRTRLVAAARWIANALLEVSSGYGARPSRVVLFSLGLILAFTPLFWVLRPAPPYPSFPVLGYLLLSFESFATGVRPGGPGLSDPVVRFVSSTEAFVGVFLIALFVFTLTRSINR